MRSAFALAAFAAGALAVPFAENKRGLEFEYDTEVKYVTNVVTVFAYGPGPTDTPKAPHYGHKSGKAPPAPAYHDPAPPAPVHENSTPPPPTYEDPAPPPPTTHEDPAPPAPAYNPPTTDSPSGGKPTNYKEAVLKSHNLHRANSSVPALEWDDELEKCAETLAKLCVYEHNVKIGGGVYGQNIAAGVEAHNVTAIITDMFYNGEEPIYPGYGVEPDMTKFEEWGHYSQMVWKNTTHVACYTYQCDILSGTGEGVPPHFTVCNYGPPGNYAGQYTENVLKPNGGPSVDWSASSY